MSRRTRNAVEVKDAAQMLASEHKPVSSSTVYRLIHKGELEAFKLTDGRTGKILIYEDSIEAFKTRRAVAVPYDRKRIRELLAS